MARASGALGTLKQCLATVDRLKKDGVFEVFFDALAYMSSWAHLIRRFDSTIVRAARICASDAGKGAAGGTSVDGESSALLPARFPGKRDASRPLLIS